MTDGIYATRAEVAALRREMRELRAEMRALRRGNADPRLGAFLKAVFGFSRSEPWTVAEILAETHRARDREVLAVVDELTGDATNRCISLGRWCARHAGASADGLTLHQIRDKHERVWIYFVSCG